MGGGTLVATLALASTSANAQWQDPLQTPAMETSKAVKSLLLDVVYAGKRLVAVGERGHILLSDDEGYSWSQADVPVMSTLTSIFFIDASVGWAVGHDAVVLKTQDGGQTWKKQFDGFQANTMLLAQAKQVKAQLESELSKANVIGNLSLIHISEPTRPY